jgi:DedD protein
LNQAMKQRLIGTTVLLCLALIFIPLLLDGQGIAPPAMNLNIPPRPQIETPSVSEPVRPEIVGDQLDSSGAVPQLELPPFVDESEPQEEVVAAVQPQVLQAPTPAPAEPPKPTATPAPAPAPVATPAPAAERVPAMDTAGLPEGWVVRLGTFGERANADRLLKQLLDARYKAYIESVTSAQGVLSGVYVGPVLTRAEADSLQRDLRSRFQLDGLIRRFSLDETQ